MSAPSVSGRWTAGDADVLSTTTRGRRTPFRRAPPDGPYQLADIDGLGGGFVGDSNQTSRVRSTALPQRIHPRRQVDECRVDVAATGPFCR